MPALTLFRNFTTKPLAGDDLQLVCFVLGVYRAIQLVCIIPILINILVQRFNGKDLTVNHHGSWCPQYDEAFQNRSAYLVLAVENIKGYEIKRESFGGIFIIIASVFTAMDLAWILAVWGAATIGTPTQPMGRDEYLRKLMVFKMVLILFPIVLIIFGCIKVYRLRRDNYGCGDEDPTYYPDTTWDYVLYCLLLVTYALEVLVLPAIVARKITRWIRSNQFTQRYRYETKAKGERLEQCLGGLLRCVSVLCCNKAGGKDIKNQGELKDFASNLMAFANNDTHVGVVLSDMYVGGKMLARVQAERRVKTIQALQIASNRKGQQETATEEEVRGSSIAPVDRRGLLDSKDIRHRRSILTLQADEEGKKCVVVEKKVLTSSNEEDVDVLRNAAHYSVYAEYIYFHVRMALEDILSEDASTFVRDFDIMAPMEKFSFAMFQAPHAHLFYANFHNGISATPYAILVDEEEKSVVVAVRGTLSLEDWVIDLQYVPQPLDKVGELCGFNGKGHHCHKGVLTRCKWMYNDIKKQKVLKHLYSSDSMYKNYNLVVVGHSLGGGCAQVLSLMLRPSFPSLRCFAYEPPGCIFDDVLSEDCKEWITSIVRHEDVVPRVTQPNLESLRDEFFDVVARIKVPKCNVFQDVRTPCPESHLASRNANVLCPRGEIDRDTTFYAQVQKFRNERATKNLTGDVSVKLYIPGQIVHLVDTKGDETKYVPYWASRYEFNQVILSGRMLADHAIPPLVQILKKLDLDDVHEVHAWHTDDKEVEDDDNDIPTPFIPFSNPQGKLPLILILLAVVACIMATFSNQVCKYVTRSTILLNADGTESPGFGLSVGLWSYSLKQCKDDVETCDTEEPDHLEDSPYCQPYGQLFDTVDVYWRSARTFGSLSALLGLLSIGLISTATCTKLKKRTWIVMVILLLIATIFQGLQFLMLKSDLCNEWTHPDPDTSYEKSRANCSISRGGICGIIATVLWFFIAAGCSHMARMA